MKLRLCPAKLFPEGVFECDRTGCSKLASHWIEGYLWGVPAACLEHAEEDREAGFKIIEIEKESACND
jgi:hypothetical protein